MDTKTDKLTIGYAGTLNAFQARPGAPKWRNVLRNWFWLYRAENINFHTRSGYYLFRGIAALAREYPEAARQLEVQLWGRIDPVNQIQVQEMGIQEIVRIEGYMTKAETVARLNRCDALFLPLESEKEGQKPLFIPGKLYEYLNLRKPVLALAGPSDCRDILMESGLGIVCDPFDETEIAAALRQLILDRDQLAQRFQPNEPYIEGFRFEKITRRLAGIFDTVLDR